MKINITVAFALFMGLTAMGQMQPTQTIRGKVLDKDSKVPFIGATIVLIGSDPLKGSASDMDGNFRIEEVPVGRASLKISYVGYEEQVLPNILVNSGKETVLSIEIIESVLKMDEIVGKMSICLNRLC